VSAITADATLRRPRSGLRVPRNLRTAWRRPQTKVGAALVFFTVGLAILGPAFAPHSPTQFVGAPFTPAGGAAALGTDYLGRDVLSVVLNGGRSLLWMAFASTTIGVAGGVLLGMVAAYSRNLLDDLIMRLLDVLYAFPYIVLVLLFVSLLGSHTYLIVLLVAVGWLPGVARTTRGITLEVITREFVQAADIIGVPRRRILLREVLPNLSTPLLVEYALRLTWSVGVISALSFLGFGVQPPASDWGLMINQNRTGLAVNPWSVLAPIICIAVFAIGTNLIADGISRSVAGIDRELPA
jgi:peptide/nickel transport system permease protein